MSAPPGAEPGGGERPAEGRSPFGRYRPGLDGLRALAVTAVLAYHSGFEWARGGFLGVSLFFTLSGFLVTSMVLARGGARLSLRRFWVRRVRRLLPAALLTLAGIVVFGATVATREQADQIPGHVLGAATYVSNWVFLAGGTSYGDQFAAPSPVLHFWSLSIEEQLYVVLPLLVVGVLRWSRSASVLGAALAAVAVASTAWMALLHASGASLERLYYGTDTRAAEVLVGALLAVVVTRVDARGRAAHLRPAVAGVGAVAAVAVVALLVSTSLADDRLYRGGFLLVALASGTTILGVLADRGPLRLLGRGPLPAVGRVSYGLYLFHFPIFLWLTEDRTGIRSPAALFALRVAVTGVAAAASYRWVEQPIRHGSTLGLPSRARFALVPVTAAAIALVAAVAVTLNRSETAATAAFDATAALPPPVPPADGVLDVLVLTTHDGRDVATALDARAGEQMRVAVSDLEPCDALTGSGPGRTCAAWATGWPAVVEAEEPDLVLLLAAGWPGPPPPALAPGEDAVAVVRGAMAASIALLAEQGAPVVWAYAPPEGMAGAVARASDPFFVAMEDLQRTHDHLRARIQLPAEVEGAADVLADRLPLHQRRAGSDARVMIVGDSQAHSVRAGLERWSAAHGGPVVWDTAVGGCGLVLGGVVRDALTGREGPPAEECERVPAGWPEAIDRFDPDRVIVLSSLRDVQDRRLDGWDGFAAPGDEAFDDLVLSEYLAAVDALSAGGADVVWLEPPCLRAPEGGFGGGATAAFDPDRVAHLADHVLPELERRRPGVVEVYPLADLLCPDGRFLEEVEGVGPVRPDGVHLSEEGTGWLATILGPDLLVDLGG